MTDDKMKAVLDRVLTWSPERQGDAARLLASMESQDESLYGLSDDQVAEVQRRRSDTMAQTLPLAQFNERFGRPR